MSATLGQCPACKKVVDWEWGGPPIALDSKHTPHVCGKETRMQTKDINIEELHPHHKNVLRRPSEGMWNLLKRSIVLQGILEPLRVNEKTMEIISGNNRYAIAEELGMKKLPCILVSPEEAEELVDTAEDAEINAINLLRIDYDSFQKVEGIELIEDYLDLKSRQGTNQYTKGASLQNVAKQKPSDGVAKVLNKSQTFVSAAHLFNSLPEDQQAALKKWFYEQDEKPTDKAFIEEIQKANQALTQSVDNLQKEKARIESVLKEYDNEDVDKQQEIEKLKESLKKVKDDLAEEKKKTGVVRSLETLEKKADEIKTASTKLNTALVHFKEAIEKLPEKTIPGGMKMTALMSNLKSLNTELTVFYKICGVKSIGAKEITNGTD